MGRTVELPPESGARPDGLYAGGWWHSTDDERIVCDLCPRECHLKSGDRGFCFVRQNVGGEMMLTTYGKSTGFCIDPIEKKPLNHFLPGTSVLSFGTAGCNLGCKFCQNWDISKSRQVERLSELAGPAAIADAAQHYRCRSVAYTYNDPVIWAEYAIDTARACRERGIKNVAVTAGYISPAARGPFYRDMDAANVDLKAFTEEFYYKLTYSHLQPVLDTLTWLARETEVWFEITNLVIPRTNDSLDEIRQMCDWILQHVGDTYPLHFSAFHPDFRLLDVPATPPELLAAARETALRQGLKYVYVGNVNDVARQSTYCPGCGGLLIARNWYELGEYHLRGNRCGHCDAVIAGVFEDRPGDWGRKRLPVPMNQFAKPLPIAAAAAHPTQSLSEKGSKGQTPFQTGAPIQLISQENQTMSSTSTGGASPAAPGSGGSARLQAQRPKLTDQQQQQIHAAASEIVAAAIARRPARLADPSLAGAADRTVMGAFVTLKRQGRLRACCGALGRPMPLSEALRQSALRTATEDSRLPTISPIELPYLDLDVSLLYGFQPLTSTGRGRIAEVEIGRHGLQIQYEGAAGLLLPNVATEQGYDSEQFLQQVCRKAGLGANTWESSNVRIQTFESCMIPGEFAPAALAGLAEESPLLSPDELRTLAAACGANIVALAQGATPSYYIAGVSDGAVNGVAVTLKPQSGEPRHFFQLQMRPGVPMQSTAFALCDAAAKAIRSGSLQLASGNVTVSVSLLRDPAMHGTVAEPDWRGINPARRAVLVMEAGKSAWVFDPTQSAQQLLDQAVERVQVFHPEAANIFSFAIETTDSAVVVSNAPRPVREVPTVRPPAVANRFYPGDAAELAKMIDGFLAQPPRQKEQVPAIMVPHAGLIYSGQTAGDVFKRVEIPDTVIIIGPKHTRLGVEWAVAPHARWSFPGGELETESDLARQLCAAIPGLQMDAAAHAAEHGIEVELPFIHRLNPRAKVVGIVIGAGDLPRCRQFAAGLAQVVRERTDPVLLIVSSDMNHYATDDENRRLDEIAMQALATCDPEQVYDTVVGQGISMCGVLPAVMVMQTLRELQQLHSATRIAYATSADATGDKNRVVGYCGMTFA